MSEIAPQNPFPTVDRPDTSRSALRVRIALVLLGLGAGGCLIALLCRQWALAAVLTLALVPFGLARLVAAKLGGGPISARHLAFLGLRWLARSLAGPEEAPPGPSRYGVGQLMALVEAAREYTGDMRNRAALSLNIAHELERIPPAGLAALDDYERTVLRLLLVETNEPELAIALLSTLMRMGDVGALREVDQIAALKAPTSPMSEVIQAAQVCAASLRKQARDRTDAATLLRPAEPDASSTLLRPAESAPPTPDEQLLRPASGSDTREGETRARAEASDNKE